MLEFILVYWYAFPWPTQLSPELVALTVLMFAAICAGLERAWPSRNWPAEGLRRSFGANLSLFAVNNTLLSLLSVSSLFVLAQQFSGYGLLQYLPNPLAKALLALLLLDLLLYAWHRVCHHYEIFWWFHRVHHNDPYLNSSTAFRVHITELVLTNLLKAGYIVVTGVDQLTMMTNELLVTLFTLFHHTNIRFGGEKWLGKLFVVPALHRSHHAKNRAEHDSNYGAVFSFWDRLFGTLNLSEPKAVGIHGDSPQDLIRLMKFGFNLPQGETTTHALPANLEAMIAEAAYYRAEKRNFSPGYELVDWLEARQEIFRNLYSEDERPKVATKYGLVTLG